MEIIVSHKEKTLASCEIRISVLSVNNCLIISMIMVV